MVPMIWRCVNLVLKPYWTQRLNENRNRMTHLQIVSELTVRGIPTKTGRSIRWTHQAVARILQRQGTNLSPRDKQPGPRTDTDHR